MIGIASTIFIGQFTGFLSAAINTILHGNNIINPDDPPLIQQILGYITGICNASSSLLMYLFMAFQLIIVFKNTVFQVQKSVIYAHFILFIVILILVISMLIIAISGYKITILLAIFFILASIGAMHMAWLFNRKLYLMVLKQRKHSNTFSDSSTNQINNSTIDAQRELSILNVIIKITVIFTLYFISTIFIIVVLMALIILNSTLTIALYYVIFGIYAVTPSLSIFLMLSMNNDIYGCLCKCCHHQFSKLCHNLAITDDNKQEKTLNQRSKPNVDSVNTTTKSRPSDHKYGNDNVENIIGLEIENQFEPQSVDSVTNASM